MSTLLALVLATPWVVVPVITLARMRGSPSLTDVPDIAPEAAPLVSLVIPARNEARNIDRCVRSALASTYPNLEVIAVDDHSTDDTGRILREIALTEPRLRVATPGPLPPGWFGKQWACSAGQAAGSGEIVGFMDADTWQSPDLVTRIVNTMRARNADLVTIAGTQEMGSFWEKLIQPQMFSIMAVRYGGAGAVNSSARKHDKIANGQCIFVRRDAHDSIGGHGAVRDKVAEDLALAQLYFERGKRSFLVLGLEQLWTRMYTSFAELNTGWGKNIYAGGRDAMPGGAIMRALYPVALLSPSLAALVPTILAILGAYGLVGRGLFVWSATVALAGFLWWSLVYTWLRISPLYALLSPLGGAALFYISLGSLVRGRRVRWKDRNYVVTGD